MLRTLFVAAFPAYEWLHAAASQSVILFGPHPRLTSEVEAQGAGPAQCLSIPPVGMDVSGAVLIHFKVK